MKRKISEKNVFLLDTMILINFCERCESYDLIELFSKAGFSFQIVEEVEKEFKKGIKPIGQKRFDNHTATRMINIISNDNIEIDEGKMEYLINKGFGKGELFSSLYFITCKNIQFVSDEKVVQNVFNNKFNINIFRTSDLLDLLIEKKMLTLDEKKKIFSEMVRNGLWIKP